MFLVQKAWSLIPESIKYSANGNTYYMKKMNNDMFT